MKTSVLASGSGGNCIVVLHEGTGLLVDAGIPAAEVDRRLLALGIVGHASMKALFVSHNHGDHARYAEKIEEQWHVERYGTFSHTEFPCGLKVELFPVPHDATYSVGYVIEAEGRKLACVLDAGCITPEMTGNLNGSDVIIIGTDYCDDLLDANDSYPAELKNRIRSNTGHLSNQAVATFLRDQWDGRAHTIVLSHLSRVNNSPERALSAVKCALVERRGGFVGDDGPMNDRGQAVKIIVSTQDQPTELIEV